MRKSSRKSPSRKSSRAQKSRTQRKSPSRKSSRARRSSRTQRKSPSRAQKSRTQRKSPSRKSSRSRRSSRKSSRPRKIQIAKDILKPYGYHDVKSLTVLQRHRALKSALADGVEPLALFRRLNVLYVFNKNTNPVVAAKFKADATYVKNTKEYKHRS